MSQDKNISTENLDRQLKPLKDFRPKPPEAYFDTLNDRIMARITEDQSAQVITMERSDNRVYWSIAAGIALLLGVFTLMQLNINESANDELAYTWADWDLEEDSDLNYLLAIEDDLMLEVYFDSEEQSEESSEEIEFLLQEDIELEELINAEL